MGGGSLNRAALSLRGKERDSENDGDSFFYFKYWASCKLGKEKGYISPVLKCDYEKAKQREISKYVSTSKI